MFFKPAGSSSSTSLQASTTSAHSLQRN